MLGTGVNLIYILSKIDSKLCLETSHNVRWILEMTFSFIFFFFFATVQLARSMRKISVLFSKIFPSISIWLCWAFFWLLIMFEIEKCGRPAYFYVSFV